jgi:hypothetical protein
MNFIGIDPSLISTAIVVNGKIINYCRESDATTKKGMSKWFKSAEQYCDFSYVKYREFENYSDGELIKLKDYDLITDKIISDILSNIDTTKTTWVAIEGYNFGSQVGDIIDLVSFSTLLRKKIFDKITHNIEVFSPTSLKLESCKFSYDPIIKEIGKKKKRIVEEYRNPIGIPGGKFTKREICLAIIDSKLEDNWSNYLRSIKDDIMMGKNIPKPHEDINDSWFLYHIIKKKNHINS